MTILNPKLIAAAAVKTAAEVRYATAIAEWQKCGGFDNAVHVELIDSEMAVVTAREEVSHEIQLARTVEVRGAMFAYLDVAVRSLDPEIENAWLRADLNRERDEVTLEVVAGFGSYWANVHSDYTLDEAGLERLIADVEMNWLG